MTTDYFIIIIRPLFIIIYYSTKKPINRMIKTEKFYFYNLWIVTLHGSIVAFSYIDKFGSMTHLVHFSHSDFMLSSLSLGLFLFVGAFKMPYISTRMLALTL